MFKFFRVYNKAILVVGGVVLMVAFLVPQAVTMFAPNPGNTSIGSVHGQEITEQARQNAAYELKLLASIFRLAMPMDEEGQPLDDGLAWLMLQADARDMGLWASDGEVLNALDMVGLPPEELATFATNQGLTEEQIKQAVRHWIVAEQYRQLVDGVAFSESGESAPSPALRRLQIINQMMQFAQQFQGQMDISSFLNMALIEANGTTRLSGPALGHFVNDNYASIGGKLLLVAATPDAAEPNDATLQKLFDTYKDQHAGQGEPYPFGYLVPDRVKIEYLQIPLETLRDHVRVGNVEVLEFYRNNKQDFAPEDSDAPATPTAEARKSIEERLRDQASGELFQTILTSIQSKLADDTRGMSQPDGWYDLPDDFEPTPLGQIAQSIKDEFGVEPRVMGDPEQWVGLDELSQLPGVGNSMMAEAQDVTFANYIGYAKGLVNDTEDAPRSLRIQPGIGSRPLIGFDPAPSAYLFRLTDTAPAHPPAGLAEVRERVVTDAKLIASFEKLKSQSDEMRGRVIADGLDAVASSQDGEVIETPLFQRLAPRSNEPAYLPGVGSNERFIDAAFALVEDVDPSADISEMPLAQRLAVVPLESTAAGVPGLALFSLDKFEALTRSAYLQRTREAAYAVSFQLNGDEPAAPISRETLAKRVGFDLDSYEE